jgi:predicted ribosomally synthesized peptide with nif11-like leader
MTEREETPVPIDDLKAFFAAIETDTVLQDKARALQSLPEADRLTEFCRLAAEAGFTVSPEDWKTAAAGSAGAELDDESLRAVVGGLCNAVGGIIAQGPSLEFHG